MYQRKEINFYQISGSDSLPEDGWFQNCKCCKRTITGNLKLITTVEGRKDVKYFRIYTCKECEKQIKVRSKFVFSFNITHYTHINYTCVCNITIEAMFASTLTFACDGKNFSGSSGSSR